MYFIYRSNKQKEKIYFTAEDSILDALIKNKRVLDSPCGGHGTCGKCKVHINGQIKLACETKAQESQEVSPFSERIQTKGFNQHIQDLFFSEETGLAIDIGTTGIEYKWICLKSGLELGRGDSYNDQTRFGSDVFSRMAFAMTQEENVSLLQKTLVNQLNREMLKIVGPDGSKTVKKIIIAANTTMCHFLLGLDSSKMAKFPYKPEALSYETYEVSFKDFTNAKTIILPCASAFIGGDVLGGISTFYSSLENQSLFMDIGTNGEIAIVSKEGIFATSTAAGPAFEGMNISCGSRAIPGAISNWTLENERPKYQTIADEKAQSICGSGLLHAVSNLLKNGKITQSGRFSKEVGPQLELAPNVTLTQKDIRQVQLAKGAILSGISALLTFHNIQIGEIQTLYVAGNLGSHLSEELLKRVGLIPSKFNGNIVFLGNASLQGAVKVLLNATEIQTINLLSKSTKVLELSTLPYFQDEFVKALTFDSIGRDSHDMYPT